MFISVFTDGQSLVGIIILDRGFTLGAVYAHLLAASKRRTGLSRMASHAQNQGHIDFGGQ
jgi:hypothetical protein